MQLAYKYLILFFFIFLTSCFLGPVKELKIQIEDSWAEDSISDLPELKPIKNSIQIYTKWKIDVGNNFHDNFNLFLDKDKLFLIDTLGNFYKLNSTNGEILFNKNFKIKVLFGLTGDKEAIYFTTEDGFLWSLSHDGLIQWKVFVGQVLTKPFISKDSIVVRSLNYKFSSINKKDGSLVWAYQSPLPPLTINAWGEMTSYDNKLFSGLPGGKVLALDINLGTLLWEVTYSQPKGSTEIDRANDTTGSITNDEYNIYAVSSKGNIASITINEGLLIWSRALSSFYGPHITQNSLFITHNSDAIYALNKDNNKVLWRNADFIGRGIHRGHLNSNYLIFGDSAGYLHFVNIIDGNSSGRLKIADNKIIDNYVSNENFNFLGLSNNGVIFSVNFKSSDYDIANKNNQSIQPSIDGNIDESNNQNIENEDDSFLDSLKFWN